MFIFITTLKQNVIHMSHIQRDIGYSLLHTGLLTNRNGSLPTSVKNNVNKNVSAPS